MEDGEHGDVFGDSLQQFLVVLLGPLQVLDVGEYLDLVEQPNLGNGGTGDKGWLSLLGSHTGVAQVLHLLQAGSHVVLIVAVVDQLLVDDGVELLLQAPAGDEPAQH